MRSLLNEAKRRGFRIRLHNESLKNHISYQAGERMKRVQLGILKEYPAMKFPLKIL